MHISIVICTRNRAHSIVRCLASIDEAARAASLTDAEIVIIDNASDDDTSSVVRNWATGSSIPVILEYEPRAGITIEESRTSQRSR